MAITSYSVSKCVDTNENPFAVNAIGYDKVCHPYVALVLVLDHWNIYIPIYIIYIPFNIGGPKVADSFDFTSLHLSPLLTSLFTIPTVSTPAHAYI